MQKKTEINFKMRAPICLNLKKTKQLNFDETWYPSKSAKNRLKCFKLNT